MVRIGMAPGGATSVTYHATRSMDSTPVQTHWTKGVGLIHISCFGYASVNDTHVSDQPPAHLFLPACFCHYFPMRMRELC